MPIYKTQKLYSQSRWLKSQVYLKNLLFGLSQSSKLWSGQVAESEWTSDFKGKRIYLAKLYTGNHNSVTDPINTDNKIAEQFPGIVVWES